MQRSRGLAEIAASSKRERVHEPTAPGSGGSGTRLEPVLVCIICGNSISATFGATAPQPLQCSLAMAKCTHERRPVCNLPHCASRQCIQRCAIIGCPLPAVCALITCSRWVLYNHRCACRVHQRTPYIGWLAHCLKSHRVHASGS